MDIHACIHTCIYVPIERSLLQPQNSISSADTQIRALGSVLRADLLHILYFDTVVECEAICLQPSTSMVVTMFKSKVDPAMTIERKWMDKVIRYCSNSYQILFCRLQEILEINIFFQSNGSILMILDAHGHTMVPMFGDHGYKPS